jgi:hypothetical protein
MIGTVDLDSPLPLAAVRRIDQLCDRYEEALQAGDRPPLEALLDAVDAPHRPSLLKSLLEVDLEYRRAWGEEPAPGEYEYRFPEMGEAVRAAFCNDGERLDVSPDDRRLVEMMLSQATGRRVDRLRIYYGGRLAHTMLLTGPVELGRQQQGEAPPFAVTKGKYGRRLVVAPLEETSVSRHHAILAPEGEDRIRVTNLSNVNPIVLSGGGRLHYEESDTLPRNLEMTLGAVFLRIDCPGEDSESSIPPLHDQLEPPPAAKEDRGGFLQRLWRRGE